jgi:hypothetical protein
MNFNRLMADFEVEKPELEQASIIDYECDSA